MTQLSYSLNNTVAVEGAMYDGAVVRDKVSGLVELAAGIRVGKLCVKSTDDDQVALPTLAADITDGLAVGVSMLDLTLETKIGTPQPPQYSEKDSIPLVRKGRIWVVTEAATVKGDDVYVRFQNGDDAATFDGGFSNAAGADFALLAGAKWFTSQATPDGLAVVELNLP